MDQIKFDSPWNVETIEGVLNEVVTARGTESSLSAKIGTKQDVLTLDEAPTQNSENFVTSGATYTGIKNESFWRVGVEITPYVTVTAEEITTGNATVRHPVKKSTTVLTLPDGVTTYTDADNDTGTLKDSGGNTVGSINLTTGVLTCANATVGSKITYDGANDMNDYVTPGVYYVGSGSYAGIITNTPKSLAARVEIFPLWGSTRIMQRYFTYSSGEAKYYMRGYNPSLQNPWGAWYEYGGTLVT